MTTIMSKKRLKLENVEAIEPTVSQNLDHDHSYENPADLVEVFVY